MKNPQGKRRDVNSPYEIWRNPNYPNWEWRVLKYYNAPDKRGAPNARAFCAVKSPFTGDGYDLGDTYVLDFQSGGGYLAYSEAVTGSLDEFAKW